MRVVSPAMTRVWTGEGRTPRTAQPMARITVSKLQAAANRTAAASMENHSMEHLLFRPFYSGCESVVHGVAFCGGLCYTGL